MDAFRRPSTSTELPKILAEAPTARSTTALPTPVHPTAGHHTVTHINNATHAEVAKPAESHDNAVKPKKRIIRIYGRKPLPQNQFTVSDTKTDIANTVTGSTRQHRTNRPYIVQYTPKSNLHFFRILYVKRS